MRERDVSGRVRILRYQEGQVESLMDSVVCEEHLKLYLGGELLMETPVSARDLEDLVTGYLFGEGLISPGDRPSIRFKGDSCHVGLSSSEGSASRSLSGGVDPGRNDRRWKAAELTSLMNSFNELPSVYHETGGAHMAAFASPDIIHWADDISRRNAVDKVLGKGFRRGNDLRDGILLSSGRISSDMIMRMVHTGLSFIASVSAPSDRAVELALEHDITVCAFVRGERFNVYGGAGRLILPDTLT